MALLHAASHVPLVNAIVGHERETVGDEYGGYVLSSLARELDKMP